MNINKLNSLIDGKKITKAYIVKAADISRPSLDAILAGGDFKVSNLEKIAKILKVPVGYLFDEESKPEDAAGYKSDLRETNYDPTNLDNINLPSDCPAHTRFLVEKEICEIRHLKNLIADKERMLDCFLDSVND